MTSSTIVGYCMLSDCIWREHGHMLAFNSNQSELHSWKEKRMSTIFVSIVQGWVWCDVVVLLRASDQCLFADFVHQVFIPDSLGLFRSPWSAPAWIRAKTRWTRWGTPTGWRSWGRPTRRWPALAAAPSMTTRKRWWTTRMTWLSFDLSMYVYYFLWSMQDCKMFPWPLYQLFIRVTLSIFRGFLK